MYMQHITTFWKSGNAFQIYTKIHKQFDMKIYKLQDNRLYDMKDYLKKNKIKYKQAFPDEARKATP
jgi:hypothetical protein